MLVVSNEKLSLMDFLCVLITLIDIILYIDKDKNRVTILKIFNINHPESSSNSPESKGLFVKKIRCPRLNTTYGTKCARSRTVKTESCDVNLHTYKYRKGPNVNE